jgi:hypothetical protein
LCRKWLRSDLPQDEIKSILVSKYEDAKLEYHAVSKDLFQPKVNSDVSTILEKVDYEELSV